MIELILIFTLPINLPLLICPKLSLRFLSIVLIHILLQGYGNGVISASQHL